MDILNYSEKKHKSLYYNMLLERVKKVSSGELPCEKLEEILSIFFTIHRKASLLYTNLRPLQVQTDELKELELYLEEFSGSLEALSKSYKNSNWTGFSNLSGLLGNLLDRIFDCCARLRKKEFPSPSPSALTVSPVVNELIFVAANILEEGRGEKALEKKVEFFRTFLHITKEQFSELLKVPDSSVLNIKGPLVMTAFNRMEYGLEDFTNYLKDKDKKYIVSGIEKIKFATKELVELKEFIEKSFFLLFHRFCLNCGQENYIDRSICKNCNSPLQAFSESYNTEEIDKKRVDYEEVFPKGIMLDSTILDITDKIELFYFDGISSEEFEGHLMKFEKKLNIFEERFSHIKCYEKFDSSEEYILLNEFLLKTSDCIKEFKISLKFFRKYLFTQRKEDFLFALKKIVTAGAFLHTIQDICEVCERSLSINKKK